MMLNSMKLAILIDQKEKAAIDLGYKIVSGEKTNRIDSWIKFILKIKTVLYFVIGEDSGRKLLTNGSGQKEFC